MAARSPRSGDAPEIDLRRERLDPRITISAAIAIIISRVWFNTDRRTSIDDNVFVQVGPYRGEARRRFAMMRGTGWQANCKFALGFR